MIKRISIVLIILICAATNAQNNYKNLWKKVEVFEIDGLPKSALKVVDSIYAKAKSEQESPQIIKSLFYKSKFALILEEDAQLKVINQLKLEIKASNYPTKNILQNVLANLYWQYFNQNRYKFYNRTETKSKVNSNDFRTWDLNTLFKEVHAYFDKSLLESEILQGIDITLFQDILLLDKGARTYTPTLFDFLANNALNFYKTNESAITKPSYQFVIDDAKYIADYTKYKKQNINAKDSLSLQLNALKIYQKIIDFHATAENFEALANIDIRRLEFVNANATFNDKEKHLYQTLKIAKQTLKNTPSSGLYAFKMAEILNNQANKKEALAICNEVLKKFPESLGAQKCKILQKNITAKTLAITTEEFIPINQKSRLLVTYKNIPKLYFKAYRINNNQLRVFNKTHNLEARLKLINVLNEVTSWQQALRDEKDHIQHSTEIIVPEFKNGMYLIIASEEQKPSIKGIYGTATIQATNLTLVKNSFNGTNNFQVVDRVSGEPIKKAEIRLTNKYRYRGASIMKTLKTDRKGFASYNSRNYYSNVDIKVTTKNDTLLLASNTIYEKSRKFNSSEEDEIRIKPFIFTDRSIYRPGQKVYFKAILIKKIGEKSELLTNEFVEIALKDVNGQVVKQLDLKLNEYGSVAGEFTLPDNGLTGEYSIEIDESYEYDSKFYDKADFYFEYPTFKKIAVEEYKRPKFETTFNAVKETFKVNDSISVTGLSKAFSGANITDATVVYRVKRKVQYPSWYFWYRPRPTSESQEITNGETTTNENGEFTIVFKAIPDSKTDKESLPIFSYEITADVTDVNGETRSATQIVKVGYHSLVAKINAPNRIDKNNPARLTINTKNLNDEFVAAKGTLKIYKLNAPKTALRPRPWAAPDYQQISEREFRSLFPHDPYSNNESDEKNWTKGKLVFSTKFDTEKSKEIQLENTSKWLSGKYIVVLESKDKFGQEVKDQQRVTVFSTNDKKVADQKLFTINTDKILYATGDDVLVTVGSASKNITVVLQVEKNYKIISTQLIALNNETKTIKIPVHKNDNRGFAIKWHYVNFNYFDSGNLSINVAEKSNNISFTTNVFRDKLQPGQTETWSFSLNNDTNDAIAAEVLASMYDASLDEFKAHNWQFNPTISKSKYYSYSRSSSNSFDNVRFSIKNLPVQHYTYPKIGATYYNWFGFNISENNYLNQQYLRNLRAEAKAKIIEDRDDYDFIIRGTISDESGVLPGVSIRVFGTTYGTETDFDGNYTLKVKKGEELQFAYLGYKIVSKTITDNSTFNLSLEEDANALDEVVVVGYGTSTKTAMVGSASRNASMRKALQGEVAGVTILNDTGQPGANSELRIRGNASVSGTKNPLYIVDGKVVTEFNLEPAEIISMNVLKNAEATALYGAKGANGVVIITTKTGQAKLDKELSQVQARKNFKETAFFYPQLKTDKNGQVSFTFTMPEALTRWKLQLLAHSKSLKSTTKTLQTVTQKELMVVPNAPRFLREKDTIHLSAKITNLTNNQLSGFAKLILTDAISGKEIDSELQNIASNKNFTVDKDGNTSVSWQLVIPENIAAVQYKIVAKAGDFSDGEQTVLPVLTNRMLVTETLPMYVKTNQTKTFTLDKLKNNTSSTLKNHKLTLEITSNPAWYALQALPYLMEYPYECSEQTFSRYYANTIASYVANSNPRIQEVFNAWKTSDALLSNLEKNQELKSLIIQETPWLRSAQSESEQKKRIAILFDLNRMKNEQQKSIEKLKDMQMSSGGFPWFKGGRYESNFITQYIASGFGHLKQLGVSEFDTSTTNMMSKTVQYLDNEIAEQFKKLLENASRIKEEAKTEKLGKEAYNNYLKANHLNYFTIQYLYMRSFYSDISLSEKNAASFNYYLNQAQQYWLDYNLYAKGQIALTLFRNDKKGTANSILKSLKENAVTSEEMGMYWKNNTAGYYYYQAPIETQALLIEAFSEIENDMATIDNLKIWLLKNKQTNSWKTTKATSEAVYALLLNGSEWLSVADMVDVTIGNQKIQPTQMPDVKVEAGTGYFKTSWNKEEIEQNMANVTISKKGKGIAWGGLYWQYFEDLDQITRAETPLKLSKKLFLKTNSNTGKKLTEIMNNSTVKVGDLITVRIEISSDRNMEFIHLKDMRASGVEPVNVISKYKWQDGLGYYESTKDAATNFFFSRLPKGVYVFEYDVRVNNAGNFSNGISTIQSMYAPEFSSHSSGIRINIKN